MTLRRTRCHRQIMHTWLVFTLTTTMVSHNGIMENSIKEVKTGVQSFNRATGGYEKERVMMIAWTRSHLLDYKLASLESMYVSVNNTWLDCCQPSDWQTGKRCKCFSAFQGVYVCIRVCAQLTKSLFHG